eukprot:CAMPEP_0170475670 /NCGR_PEP_ID=MMETSP0123-20130129/17276_1 /TAXON_ID=182087 /ORGANISM="Favella ehrenbergii, Strain Fehren 1" /LENGTH=156 /DNA_ID=CAMNT_0010746323 /DNA_START=212 /DNA_END=678 /DNA_ORIENTATION=-
MPPGTPRGSNRLTRGAQEVVEAASIGVVVGTLAASSAITRLTSLALASTIVTMAAFIPMAAKLSRASTIGRRRRRTMATTTSSSTILGTTGRMIAAENTFQGVANLSKSQTMARSGTVTYMASSDRVVQAAWEAWEAWEGRHKCLTCDLATFCSLS